MHIGLEEESQRNFQGVDQVDGRRHSWWTLSLLGAGIAVSLLGDSTLYTVLPDPGIAAQVGVSISAVGILLGVNRLVRLASNFAAGALYDRLSRKKILVASLYLGAVSTLLFAVGVGFLPLLLSRILWGVAWSGLWIGGNTAMLDLTEPSSRGRWSGRFQMWFFIGVGGTAFLGGVLTDVLGFRNALLLSGTLTFTMGILWHSVLPDINQGAAGIPAVQSKPVFSHLPWRTALPIAVPVFVIRFVFAGVMSATTILWLAGYFEQSTSMGSTTLPLATLAGSVVALRMIISVFGAPITGALSDALRLRWPVLGAAALLGAFGTWMMGTPTIGWALAGAGLAAVTSSGIQALAPVIAGEDVPASKYGRVLSVMYTFGDIGSALGPPLALGLLRVLPISRLYRGCSILFVGLVVFASIQHRSARSTSSSEGRVLNRNRSSG